MTPYLTGCRNGICHMILGSSCSCTSYLGMSFFKRWVKRFEKAIKILTAMGAKIGSNVKRPQ